MNHTLESHKVFPYIAWTVVILFAVFTYNLTTRLHAQLSDLGDETDQLEAQVATP